MSFIVSRYIADKTNKVFVQDIGPLYSGREQAELKLEQTQNTFASVSVRYS